MVRPAPAIATLVLLSCGPAPFPGPVAPATPEPQAAQQSHAPRLAPRPFTAAQLAAAHPSGTWMIHAIEDDNGRVARKTTFETSDGERTTLSFVAVDDHGDPLSGERQAADATWKELETHASWPAEATTVETVQVVVPAGTFTGPHYRIVEKTAEGERTLDYWFANDLPGPPVRSESRLDGRKTQTVELVARGWDDPRATAATVWWSGDWSRIDGKGTEHWHALDGALHGVALSPGGFEVMWVDEAPLGVGNERRIPTLFAMPGGRSAVRFAIEDREPPGLAFTNAAHDYPTAIRYAPEPDEGLLAALEGKNGDSPRTYRFHRGPAVEDADLLAADQAFLADSRKKGARGWASHFAKDGAVVDGALNRIAGRAAIEAHMAPILESSDLAWSPVLSRRAGSLGFTLGRFEARPRAADGIASRGTYVTVWRRVGKRWRIVFDAGRPRG